MSELARKNILCIKPYVPGKPIEEVARELGLRSEIIKMASNENPLGPSPAAIRTLRTKLKDMHLYPDDSCYYLKRALSQRLRVNEKEIILGNGSVEILDMIAEAFIHPGDEIIISDPSFIMYPIVIALADGVKKSIPLKENRHDFKALTQAITPKTKAIFLDNPINPTGGMNTAEEVTQFMKQVPDKVLIVFDEAYKEYITRKDYPQTINYIKEDRNVVILRTFSKIYGLAGLRLGYGIAKTSLIECLHKVRLPFNINRAVQIAGLAALDDQAHVKKSIEVNETGKQYFYRELKALGQPYVPTEANFIYLKTGSAGSQIAQSLMKEGVITRYLPCQDSGGLRITIGTLPQNKKLICALKKVLSSHSL